MYRYSVDPDDYRYSVDPGDADIALGCVVRTSPGRLKEDDLQVERLDQLQTNMVLNIGEELISNIISLRTKTNLEARNDKRHRGTSPTPPMLLIITGTLH